ncbi:hypothetical protein KC337_g109 [Hortaea werneckii]|nr:hypothetical protein KC337_g109 [Hortaea werneckii]
MVGPLLLAGDRPGHNHPSTYTSASRPRLVQYVRVGSVCSIPIHLSDLAQIAAQKEKDAIGTISVMDDARAKETRLQLVAEDVEEGYYCFKETAATRGSESRLFHFWWSSFASVIIGSSESVCVRTV